MNEELQKLLSASKEETSQETWAEKTARDNRSACNNLDDSERQNLLEIAKALIYGNGSPAVSRRV